MIKPSGVALQPGAVAPPAVVPVGGILPLEGGRTQRNSVISFIYYKSANAMPIIPARIPMMKKRHTTCISDQPSNSKW